MSATPSRLVILASGGGTNAQALIDACLDGRLDAIVVAVVTNRAEAGVVARADAAEIPIEVVAHGNGVELGRDEQDNRLAVVLDRLRPDLVVLAGWMRVLGDDLCQRFPIINLHPALPGEYPGLRAIERAWDDWRDGVAHKSGVMVHWVPDSGVDVGPVIATAEVPMLAGDTPEIFEQRMHSAEHRLIVDAVSLALGSSVVGETN